MPQEHASDLVRRIEAALLKLPPRERDIFLAHRVWGLSYRDIAHRSGLSERRVERLIARALYKVDKQLEGLELSWWERWF